MKRQMKRIRNGLVTAVLALAIAGGGMLSSFILLDRVESQALRKETADNQEEIVLTEEETDRLVMILKALEEDNLTRISNGSGASIPVEKARSMMMTAMQEMNGLMLEMWVSDLSYLIEEMRYTGRCELYADQNNLSMEVYKITNLYHWSEFLSMELTGILDARSGLLISLNLSFLGEGEWEDREASMTKEDYGSMMAIYNEELHYYTAEEMTETYPLYFLVDAALGYYSMNTSFDFSPPEKYEEELDYYRLDSADGEYYIELTKENSDFHFQLHKFNL